MVFFNICAIFSGLTELCLLFKNDSLVTVLKKIASLDLSEVTGSQLCLAVGDTFMILDRWELGLEATGEGQTVVGVLTQCI